MERIAPSAWQGQVYAGGGLAGVAAVSVAGADDGGGLGLGLSAGASACSACTPGTYGSLSGII